MHSLFWGRGYGKSQLFKTRAILKNNNKNRSLKSWKCQDSWLCNFTSGASPPMTFTSSILGLTFIFFLSLSSWISVNRGTVLMTTWHSGLLVIFFYFFNFQAVGPRHDRDVTSDRYTMFFFNYSRGILF